MKTATKEYKLLKKIKEDKFEVDQLHNYDLNLLLGNRDFQVSVIDNRTNRCLIVEDFIISSIDSYSKLVEVFEQIFDDHHLLKAGFWSSIKVGIKSNKFALVPESLFDPDSIFDYLKFNCKVNKEYDELMYYKHAKSEAVNTFAIDSRLYNWLESLYSEKEITYFHQSSALIEGVLEQLNNYPKDSIFVYVDRFKLHIITSKDNKLEYYNQFYIKQFSDYIKYIMTVMKGLNRNQLTTNVVLWGYLGKQSKHYNEFAKYIKNISFGERPKFLKFGYPFDELQDHHYFDLYNVHLCK
ncbi:MAG: DUF3822 domain-containing protein [Bacteroidetes bacterium]|nr:MAG: DUF3822 domain-containing protein [Bacteroidota bacterium]